MFTSPSQHIAAQPYFLDLILYSAHRIVTSDLLADSILRDRERNAFSKMLVEQVRYEDAPKIAALHRAAEQMAMGNGRRVRARFADFFGGHYGWHLPHHLRIAAARARIAVNPDRIERVCATPFGVVGPQGQKQSPIYTQFHHGEYFSTARELFNAANQELKKFPPRPLPKFAVLRTSLRKARQAYVQAQRLQKKKDHERAYRSYTEAAQGWKEAGYPIYGALTLLQGLQFLKSEAKVWLPEGYRTAAQWYAEGDYFVNAAYVLFLGAEANYGEGNFFQYSEAADMLERAFVLHREGVDLELVLTLRGIALDAVSKKYRRFSSYALAKVQCNMAQKLREYFKGGRGFEGDETHVLGSARLYLDAATNLLYAPSSLFDSSFAQHSVAVNESFEEALRLLRILNVVAGWS